MTANSYFLEGELRKGQFDWNADAFAEKQQQFANDLEDAIGYEFWPTKYRLLSMIIILLILIITNYQLQLL